MGISSRDYYREPNRPSSTDFREWEFWKKVIAINAAVFVLQIFLTRPVSREDLERHAPSPPQRLDDRGQTAREESRDETRVRLDEERNLVYEMQSGLHGVARLSVVDDWFALDPLKVARGQIWRLVTAGFCHDRNSIWHLLINMLFLWLFGRRLEDRFGHDEFAVFYITSLVFSSLVFVGIAWYTNSHVPAIGASGAVWGVVALYALLFPYETVYIYFVHVQIRVLAAIYFLADLHPLLLSINGEQSFGSGVAHAAHVGGAIFGFLYWKNNWQLMPLLGRASKRRFYTPARKKFRDTHDSEPRIIKLQPQVRTFASEDETFIEEQMDSVLRRIAREGEAALSEEEREILEKAKEIIRRKRSSP